VEFLVEECGEVRVRPVMGSLKDLFGLLRRPGTSPRSVEEIDEGIARWVAADDKRIR
jgi:hypothetical protein